MLASHIFVVGKEGEKCMFFCDYLQSCVIVVGPTAKISMRFAVSVATHTENPGNKRTLLLVLCTKKQDGKILGDEWNCVVHVRQREKATVCHTTGGPLVWASGEGRGRQEGPEEEELRGDICWAGSYKGGF